MSLAIFSCLEFNGCQQKMMRGVVQKANTFNFLNFLLYITFRDVYSAPHSGSVAERLKAPVLKTGDPKGF